MKQFYIKIKDKIGGNNLFLCFIVCIFLVVLLFNLDIGVSIFHNFISNIINIIPVLISVYFFIFLLNILISNKKIENFVKRGSYFKKMVLSSLLGIISTGPIYMRYGFLKDMIKKGLTFGHISTFSYSRAIKIPLLPMMILYFGLQFAIIFNIILFILSFFNGIIIDKFLREESLRIKM